MHKIPVNLVDPAGNLVEFRFLPNDKNSRGEPVVVVKADMLKPGWRVATPTDIRNAEARAAALDAAEGKAPRPTDPTDA